jgi:hypothetical protein
LLYDPRGFVRTTNLTHNENPGIAFGFFGFWGTIAAYLLDLIFLLAIAVFVRSFAPVTRDRLPDFVGADLCGGWVGCQGKTLA